MRILADTSVLVAALVASHPAHARSLPWLQRARQGQTGMFLCSHCFAELFAALSALPVRPRIGPQTARRLISESVEPAATTVELEESDYLTVLSRQSELGLAGGSVYDALIAQAARKAAVDRLVTLNESDFRRVWPDAGDVICTP